MNEHFHNFLPPAPDDSARARARHRALVAFRAASAAKPAPSCGAPWWALAFGGGCAAAALIAAVLLSWTARPGLDEKELLAQTRQLFGPALTAIVETKDGLEILTDARAGAASDQALAIDISGRGQRIRVLGFSGRQIELSIEGREMIIDPLITASGQVIIVGEDFVSDGRETATGGLSFRGRVLERAL